MNGAKKNKENDDNAFYYLKINLYKDFWEQLCLS